MGENGAGKSTLIKALTGVYQIDSGEIVDRRARSGSFTAPPTPRPPASPPCTRRSTSARTSPSARTSCSATRCAAGSASTGGDARARHARRSPARASAPRPARAAVVDLDRDAAARRDQPGDGHRLQGAHPRRADLEPRRRRGRGALRRHPPAPRPGRRDPVRLALPRPGLRDQRPHHGAAQRPVRRRVPHARARPHAAHLQDDRQGPRRARDRSARAAPRRASATAPTSSALRATEASDARERSSRPTSRSTRGEVVGFAGLLGSGRTELARLLSGADRADTGTVELARQDGLAATRPSTGLVAPHRVLDARTVATTASSATSPSARTSCSPSRPAAAGRGRCPGASRTRSSTGTCRAQRPAGRPGPMPIRNLSGGNQQKVLLGRWLATDPDLLILDEPTRGIDVGAKAEIQETVVELADGGIAVVFISSELEEVVRLSDRIVVLKDHRKVERDRRRPRRHRRHRSSASSPARRQRDDRGRSLVDERRRSRARHPTDGTDAGRSTACCAPSASGRWSRIVVLLCINLIKDPATSASRYNSSDRRPRRQPGRHPARRGADHHDRRRACPSSSPPAASTSRSAR